MKTIIIHNKNAKLLFKAHRITIDRDKKKFHISLSEHDISDVVSLEYTWFYKVHNFDTFFHFVLIH